MREQEQDRSGPQLDKNGVPVIYFTDDEFIEIAESLQDRHAIFHKFWEIGKPIFTLQIPTAAIGFNRRGKYINFFFNPFFWNFLDDYNRRFIICHEMLHVILNHGIRTKDAGSLNSGAVNNCLDIVANHLLVSKFGFSRKKLQGFDEDVMAKIMEHMPKPKMVDLHNDKKKKKKKPQKTKDDVPGSKGKVLHGDYRDLCWVDTVFDLEKHPYFKKTMKKPPPSNRSFEYYYNLLPQDMSAEGMRIAGIMGMFDDHDGLRDVDDFEELMKDINDGLTEEEKADLQDTIEKHFEEKPEGDPDTPAGIDAGNIWTFADVDTNKVKKKKKWETVIKRWVHKTMREITKDMEQWIRINRRFALVDKELILPTEMEIEDFWEDMDKIIVEFYMDTSGSCAGMKDRFFKAAASLPENRFDIRLHCFDTQCHDTTLESKKMYGFGGTSFACIEADIQRRCRENRENYPVAVFVLTDGYGDEIEPEDPAAWYWFVTNGYFNYVPKKSKKYNLDDFE